MAWKRATTRRPSLRGHERRPIFDDGSEEVVNLESMVVVGRVDRFELGAVLGLEREELLLLAGDCPQVVERRFGNG